MLNGILQQQQCFWKCNIDGSLDQPDYYLNRADCQRKMGQNLRRGYSWIGVKFEIMLRELLGLKWVGNTTRQLTIPKKSLWLVGDCLVSAYYYMAQYARSDWLLSGHYFLEMTGHFLNFFLRFNGSFELWLKLRARERKQQKRWTKYNYIFNSWK